MSKQCYAQPCELTFDAYDDASKVVSILLKNGYVCCLSREENLYIVQYLWSQGDADRNDVTFMDRCEFDENYVEVVEDDSGN